MWHTFISIFTFVSISCYAHNTYLLPGNPSLQHLSSIIDNGFVNMLPVSTVSASIMRPLSPQSQIPESSDAHVKDASISGFSNLKDAYSSSTVHAAIADYVFANSLIAADQDLSQGNSYIHRPQEALLADSNNLAYTYIITNRDSCAAGYKPLFFVVYRNGDCTPLADGFYAIHECNGYSVTTNIYRDFQCTRYFFSVTTYVNKCYNQNSDESSATYGCVASIDDVPISGVFTGQIQYNNTDETCSSSPSTFVGFTNNDCIPISLQNYSKSFRFRCQSEGYYEPNIELFADTDCRAPLSSIYIDGECGPRVVNSTIVGYQRFQCIVLHNTTSLYSDGYYYVQYYGGTSCSGLRLISEGVSTKKCLLTYDSNAQVTGSVINVCYGSYFAQLVFNSSYDCSGLYSVFTRNNSNVCYSVPDYYYYYENYYFDESQSYPSLYGGSYELLCSVGDELPVYDTSIVKRGYEGGTDSCAGTVVLFNAVTANICFQDRYAIPVTNSYEIVCSNSTDKAYSAYYNESGACLGSYEISSIERECQYYQEYGTINEQSFQNPSESLLYYYYVDPITDPIIYNYYDNRCYYVDSPLPSPSRMPTRNASNYPTVSPVCNPSSVPTITPVIVSVSQVIEGCDYSSYLANTSSYTSAIKAAISSVSGVSIASIIYFYVFPVSYSSTNYLEQLLLLSDPSTANSLSIAYNIITTTVSQASIISSQLKANISDGSFNDYLHQYAAIYGAVGLASATSGSAAITIDSTDSSSSSSSSPSDLSVGYIILIVVLVVFTFFLSLGISCYCYNRRKSVISNQQVTSTTTNPMNGSIDMPRVAPMASSLHGVEENNDVENAFNESRMTATGADFGTIVTMEGDESRERSSTLRSASVAFETPSAPPEVLVMKSKEQDSRGRASSIKSPTVESNTEFVSSEPLSNVSVTSTHHHTVIPQSMDTRSDDNSISMDKTLSDKPSEPLHSIAVEPIPITQPSQSLNPSLETVEKSSKPSAASEITSIAKSPDPPITQQSSSTVSNPLPSSSGTAVSNAGAAEDKAAEDKAAEDKAAEDKAAEDARAAIAHAKAVEEAASASYGRRVSAGDERIAMEVNPMAALRKKKQQQQQQQPPP